MLLSIDPALYLRLFSHFPFLFLPIIFFFVFAFYTKAGNLLFIAALILINIKQYLAFTWTHQPFALKSNIDMCVCVVVVNMKNCIDERVNVFIGFHYYV